MKIQVPCRDPITNQESNLIILRSSKDHNHEQKQKQQQRRGKSLTVSSAETSPQPPKYQRNLLKSASASDITAKTGTLRSTSTASFDSADDAYTNQKEIYLSAENLLTPTTKRTTNRSLQRRVSKTSPLADSSNRSLLSSPRSRNSSASDLSLSTDDLAYNFLLQSQLKSSSSSSIESNAKISMKLSFPSYDGKAHSAWDLSPRKFEQETNGEIVQSESLSVLNRRSFNFEEFFVHADNSGSLLAQEASDAADILKEKR